MKGSELENEFFYFEDNNTTNNNITVTTIPNLQKDI